MLFTSEKHIFLCKIFLKNYENNIKKVLQNGKKVYNSSRNKF